MQPGRIEDPRDNLEKATRWELYDFAKAVGINEVKEPMPALLAVQILRAAGKTNIPINPPPLGSIAVLGKDLMSSHVAADATVDALADLKRQYEQQLANPDPVPSGPIDPNNFNEVRSELKRRGVKLSRKDTKEVILEKWRALNDNQDAA